MWEECEALKKKISQDSKRVLQSATRLSCDRPISFYEPSEEAMRDDVITGKRDMSPDASFEEIRCYRDWLNPRGTTRAQQNLSGSTSKTIRRLPNDIDISSNILVEV